jgi:PAS domain S-box-containing protein
VLEARTLHVADLQIEDNEFPDSVEHARHMGFHTILAVPLMREGVAIGGINLRRTQVQFFTDRQIALLKTFADQAVIAIENVRLFKELETRNRDLTETLEQQTATSEILRVISSSPTDVQPVFDTIVQNAKRLCEAEFSFVFRFDGQLLHFAAHHGLTPEGVTAMRDTWPMAPNRASAAGRSMLDRAIAHIPDVRSEPGYGHGAVAEVANFRSIVAVPMMRDGLPIGVITVNRSQAGPFPDRQIELLKTFADQAVIAIENVRLFNELDVRNHDLTETLDQQTATGEILRVISSSPTDIQPVFDIIGERAEKLCDAAISVVSRFDGELIHMVSVHGVAPEGVKAIQDAFPMRPDDETISARAVRARAVVHVPDVLADAQYQQKGAARASGYRGCLAVPMVRDGQVIGAIFVARTAPGLFTDTQVELLKTFADQAVIAVQNVRLFQELEARNSDLTETLEQQTATSEILRVISSSPTDVQPVFDSIAQSAKRLCEAQFCQLYRFDGKLLHFVAHHGLSPEGAEAVRRAYPMAPGRGSAAARSIVSGAIEHIADVHADPDYGQGSVARAVNFRSIVAVPMIRDGLPIGSIAVARTETGLFPDRKVDLLKTFADQAVIAVQNVHLFQELEARTQDLTRSVGELRALGEVSQAVSSTLDLETVLATIVSRAVQLSGSHSGIVYEFDEATQSFHARATHQVTAEHLEALRAAPIRLGEGAVGHAGVVREPVQIADIEDDRQLVAPQARGHLTRQGMRSLLAMPLIREDRLLGGIVITRREVGAFSAEIVATLQTFAAQSVLAFQNARLFREIQRQKQYADALVETSPVAITTVDVRGTVVGWNPGAVRLFGYTEGEAIGRNVDDLVATPETREEVRTNVRRILGGERIHAIGRRARKDGTLVDVEMSSMPLVVDGAEVGFIATYHDITELLRARREAEAANEAKGAFLATMSHEIRTPMNAVIGMSGLLLNTPLNNEQREYAEIVRQSGDTLLTVINDILDFSKIEAGRLELESQPFDVRECVESALDLVASRAAEKGLDLAYVLGDGTPAAIVGDVTRLRQVLLNLLSNAVKFTERGEVVLSMSARRLKGAAGLHELTFSVRDTGIGIPADRLGRLFQSFSQVDASTTRRYGGTGLGLAISQRLTELMSGRITVTSEVGVGSDFRFTIRAAPATVPIPTRRDLTGVQPSLQGKRVLVVDDNATNRRILTSHLEVWGMLTRATESPVEGLGWIREGERFDIGILDMHMPEMDGVTLAKAVREQPAGATLPLILFTSLGRREARAEEAGFAAYLNKPIKPSQLFDALVSVLAEQPVHVPQRRVERSELDPEMAGRHPLRILLAEDNVVNQKVAIRLLGQMGYRADVAANGLEAIEAVERQTYDVVLMDVQMPELDGFEASREINRRWPGKRPRIVAMTANAMEGDRELCVAAGMDDYVAKPIRVEELVAALGRCRPRGSAGARRDAAPNVGVPTASAAGVIDRAVIERLTATMGPAFAAELIDTFIDDARQLVAALRKALTATDRDAFRRAAHSLKSTSESLGAFGLATLARELETVGQTGRLHEVGDRLERLTTQSELVIRALGEIRHGLAE